MAEVDLISGNLEQLRAWRHRTVTSSSPPPSAGGRRVSFRISDLMGVQKRIFNFGKTERADLRFCQNEPNLKSFVHSFCWVRGTFVPSTPGRLAAIHLMTGCCIDFGTLPSPRPYCAHTALVAIR